MSEILGKIIAILNLPYTEKGKIMNIKESFIPTRQIHRQTNP
jgi:hypothetical protein